VPSLASFTETPFFSPAEHFTCSVSPEAGTVSRGDWKMEYRLPYRGTILVNHEDMVKPGTVLGENRYDPPRLYMIDLNRIPGYDRHLTPREILNGLLVKAGDRVKLNSPLYKVSRPGVTGFDFTFHSPVRGRVTKIEENGIIIVREIQDYDEKPHVIKVAQPLGIKPKHIGGHLKRKPGDFVEAGQIIASDLSRGRAASVKSPTSGILKEIDKKAGTVTIQFDITPVLMKAHVRGMVQEVIPDQGVIVSGSGTRLFGVIGFGGETSGRLVEMNGAEEGEIHKGDVLFKTGSLTFGELQMAASKGASAIIAPSVESRDWLQFSGRELGVAVTGDEAIPLTLLLTSGFGDIEMKSDTAELLRDSSGSMVCVSGRTQIRAGVTRPFAIIME